MSVRYAIAEVQNGFQVRVLSFRLLLEHCYFCSSHYSPGYMDSSDNDHENKQNDMPNGTDARRIPDEEMELESLADTDSGSEDLRTEKSESRSVNLEVSYGNQRLRSRSPRGRVLEVES